MSDPFSNINYLMLEINSECNLKCIHCNREDQVKKGARPSRSLSPKEFQGILSKFKNCNIEVVKLEGLSEPMLSKDIDQHAKLLKENFIDVFTILPTNLQYDVEQTKFLETLPFIDMVYLSIDGVGETYEQHRPPAKFDKFIASLDKIKTLVPKETRSSKLHFNFTLTPENAKDLPEIYKLKDFYGLASVRINLAQNWNENESNKIDFGPNIIEIGKKYKEDMKGVPNWKYEQCYWPHTGLTVDVFGNVRQCIVNTSQEPLGNIFEDNISDLFNYSEYYINVREQLKINEPPNSCVNCDYKGLGPTLEKIFEGSQHMPARSFISKAEQRLSGAQIFIQENVISKSVNGRPDKLKAQYQWLKENQGKNYIPKLIDLPNEENGFSYKMEYTKNCENLFEKLRDDTSGDLSKLYFPKLIQIMENLHSGGESKAISIPTIKEYLETKWFGHFETAGIKDRIYSSKSLDFLSTEKEVPVHGDLTLENILVKPNDELLLIDSNNENIMSSKFLEYGKIFQSIRDNYETIIKAPSSSEKYTFYPGIKNAYRIFIELLNPSEDDMAHILFHQAIILARLLPYQEKVSPGKAAYFKKLSLIRMVEYLTWIGA